MVGGNLFGNCPLKRLDVLTKTWEEYTPNQIIIPHRRNHLLKISCVRLTATTDSMITKASYKPSNTLGQHNCEVGSVQLLSLPNVVFQNSKNV